MNPCHEPSIHGRQSQLPVKNQNDHPEGKTLIRFMTILGCCFIISSHLHGQSPSFQTYINPVIPGDHPDPTLTKIGKYFYTSGSSFNPTPKIYRSTDLVHWEVISQPVAASWVVYGDGPGEGIWGGHMVYNHHSYWHYFARASQGMFFVKAEDPAGPWSTPTAIRTGPGIPPLGQDNSIFIDEDTGKWYLLTKAGQENNHIIELDENGQPSGKVLDLTWINPDSEGNPYGWAEGPVMWKYQGRYYYSFAEHLVGKQYVMRSDTLTDDESAWTIQGENIFTGPQGLFNRPNHISPAVMLDDSTSWVIAHSYHSSSSWYAQGRQGLLCQLTYNEHGFPVIQYPPGNAVQAPVLTSSGIPWMVPKSDMFRRPDLMPEWSLLGYTSDGTRSLTVREGWLYLEPYGGSNTVLQNDGEHSYSLITRVDFEPQSAGDEAGLWIINGPETLRAKVYSTINAEGSMVCSFSFKNTSYETENKSGTVVWLKLVRNEHTISGFYSPDGLRWTRIGNSIYAVDLDVEQTQFNDFTGNRQGLYVQGKPACFDLYIYRDAYTDIPAQNPANRYGASAASTYLGNIGNNDWAMYAGVEFGKDTSSADAGVDYRKSPAQISIVGSSAASGGTIEVWLDSIGTGRKIADVHIENTGGWYDYDTLHASVDMVSGRHDVYLRFRGTGSEPLFRIKSFKFIEEQITSVNNDLYQPEKSVSFALDQNYPNPFNPSTQIDYSVAQPGYITIKLYNIIGREVMTLFEGTCRPGRYHLTVNGEELTGGVYFYKMKAGTFTATKKFLLLK